tara:strand:+ start:335 stop:523 length:189 start_codon:yes stop_codon:yes gene_type:complete
MKSINVTIDAVGNIAIETTGFSGAACLSETAELERALGAKTREVNTREMNMTSTQEVQRVRQ